MVKKIVVEESLLKVQNTLGEGCVWDSRGQRLYFVDIEQNKVFTYEPSSGKRGYELFEKNITALALLENGDGLIAAVEDGFAYIPFTHLPFPPTQSLQSLIPAQPTPSTQVLLTAGESRFNDGAVDPAGRFLAGTMGFKKGDVNSRMYSFQVGEEGEYSAPLVLDQITCTNGMGWTDDNKTLYFTDSWIKTIKKFDYDLATGKLANPQIFSNVDTKELGFPDGMCMDTEGGVWSARFGAGKVLRFTPKGEIDVEIDFPSAWNMTCLIFGGEKLDELYITSAASDLTDDQPDNIAERKDGGDLFVVKGLGFTGVERNRFKGAIPK
ncbi:hypothetical protein B9479_007794 [Cryptococcus floricola]|uniref:SMP-30/Gluconolactonase/LRE-like region domain-containing protein n=1 Tax=Cryptococcus floricola TaxID=2591691 RepID=A0A5D3AKY9_9TREE|nr:hypothetical protein B9479_007794 [Cryptococcus floricola]